MYSNNLIKKSEENRKLLTDNDSCDKYDYITAVACGAIGGIIDIFFVGMPGDSKLGDWTDKQTDKFVMGFAKKMGWNPREKNVNNVKSAIGFLERNSVINYDQRKPSDVGNVFNIAPGTHHMMSPAHSPDIIGLFFSVLNQFTSTSSFIVNGQLITIKTDTFELQGGNFITKVLCGIANWFIHLMSDIAGSSGSHGRGKGIVAPFYELFGFLQIGSFNINGEKKNLAELAQAAFTRGYDFRFAMTQAIPVVISECLIRLIWAIRRKFQYKLPLKECIPTSKHPDLRIMLLIGNGTLCVLDAVDAGVRSGGNALTFFMRLNLVAWFRLLTLVLKEVFIRIGLNPDLQDVIDAYKRTNEALRQYLEELKSIDIEAYKAEIKAYNQWINQLKGANDEKELNSCLYSMYEEMNIALPWKGDFDSFMENRNNHLVFK